MQNLCRMFVEMHQSIENGRTECTGEAYSRSMNSKIYSTDLRSLFGILELFPWVLVLGGGSAAVALRGGVLPVSVTAASLMSDRRRFVSTSSPRRTFTSSFAATIELSMRAANFLLSSTILRNLLCASCGAKTYLRDLCEKSGFFGEEPRTDSHTLVAMFQRKFSSLVVTPLRVSYPQCGFTM